MDNLFKKTETSEGAPAEQTSQGATQEKLPLKKQEGTFENLKSQYDKLQEQLTEKQNAWEKEKHELSQKSQSYEGQLQKILQEVENLKNPPPKVEELRPPQQPKEAFLDNPEAWVNYQNEFILYKDKIHENELKSVKGELRKMSEEFQA